MFRVTFICFCLLELCSTYLLRYSNREFRPTKSVEDINITYAQINSEVENKLFRNVTYIKVMKYFENDSQLRKICDLERLSNLYMDYVKQKYLPALKNLPVLQVLQAPGMTFIFSF